MDIRTEAKINIIFDKYITYIPFWLKFVTFLIPFILITGMIFYFLGFSFPTIYISILASLCIFSLVLFLIPFMSYVIFDYFFSKTGFGYIHSDFKHGYSLLYYLLLKEHHSSSKLDLELKKLEQAIENKSQLYNDVNKLDFPYINKFVSRYYRYKKINHTSIKNVVKDDLDKLNTPNPHLLLTMDDVDSELNNLINNQFNVVKLKNNEKQFNVINTTNKKHTGTNNESNKTWN